MRYGSALITRAAAGDQEFFTTAEKRIDGTETGQEYEDRYSCTRLHVPSIDLVVGGDVLYNQCHMYVGDTTPESRRNWIAALDRLAALHPKIAVADATLGYYSPASASAAGKP